MTRIPARAFMPASPGRRHLLTALAGSILLSACGGGSTNTSSASGTPDSAPPSGGTGAGSGGVQRLRIKGNTLLLPNGAPAMLRGWNWGRWGMAQPNDAASNNAQGANCVRIPLRWWGYYEGNQIDSRDDSQTATAGIDAGHLAILDAMVAQASAAGLWIILFIDSDCGQNGTQDANERAYCGAPNQYPNGHNFWSDPDARARFINVWKFVANRYRNTPYLGMFEPLPEPAPGAASDADITAFYDEVMRAIRSVAPGIPFLLGARSYNLKTVATAYNPAWSDVVYTGDLFLHTGGTHAENIADLSTRLQFLLDLRTSRNVPIFVQQCGVQSGDDPDLSYLNAMLGLLNRQNVGYTYWEYRDTYNPNAYGVLYQDGHGGWITKEAFLSTISSYFRAR